MEIGPHGDYHVGNQSCASKLAQETGGQVGPSMLFSTPSPTQVIAHARLILGKLMFQAPSCAYDLFKPIQGMKMHFIHERVCSLLCNPSWPKWDAVSRKFPPVFQHMQFDFSISCSSQVSHELCMLQLLFLILFSLAHLHAVPNFHQVDFLQAPLLRILQVL